MEARGEKSKCLTFALARGLAWDLHKVAAGDRVGAEAREARESNCDHCFLELTDFIKAYTSSWLILRYAYLHQQNYEKI